MIMYLLKINHSVSRVVASLARLSRQGELIGWESSRRPRVCQYVCVHTFKHKNLRNQLADCNHFFLKHHWGRGKAASSFGLDRIGTLVSMATDSSRKVIMGKIWLAL